MIRKECYIWVGQIAEYRGNDIAEGPSGQICCHFPVFPCFETRIY